MNYEDALTFTNVSKKTVKPAMALILGDDGRFYQMAHYAGIDGFRLCKWSIDEDRAFKDMKATAATHKDNQPEEGESHG